ncbi:hypothetical protein NFI96_004407 [Prochilodus magdalenae]|nr:hypothetical protein NFI96_004407 [Prochilodus magdalenae]
MTSTDYCNSLLAGLPLRAIRPLQLVQNAAARLIFNLPKFTHVTPLLRSLHWLPVVARIRFKTLMLAYKAKNGPAPHYLMAMVKSRAVPRALRASSTARLEPPSLRTHGRQASRLFSVLAPRWWNELPLCVRTAESLAVFKRRLKTHFFIKHLSTSTGPLFGQCLSSWTMLDLMWLECVSSSCKMKALKLWTGPPDALVQVWKEIPQETICHPIRSMPRHYLSGRLQYVQLGSCQSDYLVSSTVAPQGTVLSPFLFTLHTKDFQ